jgi:metal-responsive CopG/Arc/MetJ family transcriptional regulator
MEEKRTDIIIGAKVDENLSRALENYLQLDTHITKSEFIRDAIRRELEERAREMGISLAELCTLPFEDLKPRVSRKLRMK